MPIMGGDSKVQVELSKMIYFLNTFILDYFKHVH